MEQVNEFSNLIFSSKIKEKLLESSTVKTFKEGDIVLDENAHIKVIPIVVKGSIRVMRTDADGRELLVYYIKSGESCIMSFLGGMHHETSKVKAVAEEEVEVLFLPIEKVTLFIKDYPEWLDYIFRLYHKRFEELLDVVNAVAFKKVDERLLDLLNKKVRLTGMNDLVITHEQLANELGTARAVVSRLLKQLEDSGRLRLGRNKITVV